MAVDAAAVDRVVAACDRLLDEARRLSREKAKATALAPLERKLERRVKHVLEVQRHAVLRRLATRRSSFPPEVREAVSLRDLESVLGQAFDATRRLFARAIQEVASVAVLLGAQETIATASPETSFTLANPRAVAFLTDHGADRVTMIDETTREVLRAILVQSAEEGWSYNRTATAITDRYAEFRVGKPQQHVQSRAHLIAITETGEAYEQGNLMAAEEIESLGTPMQKSWLTVGDDRVSEGCRANQGAGWIPLTAAFPSGHKRPLRFPGCRCALLTRAKDEA